MRNGDRFVFERDPDNGCLVGPDECDYDSEGEAFYFGLFKLCGCGSSKEVYRFLQGCLSSAEDGLIHVGRIAEQVKERPDLVAELLLHFLYSRGVIEHGSTVRASWPTDLGKQVAESEWVLRELEKP